MKCHRCGQEFEPPDSKTNVCVNCGDDLRADEVAYLEQAKAAAETEAIQRWEADNGELLLTDEERQIVFLDWNNNGKDKGEYQLDYYLEAQLSKVLKAGYLSPEEAKNYVKLEDIAEWMDKSFSDDITKAQMMATNFWQTKFGGK